jgi:hypothetical protein
MIICVCVSFSQMCKSALEQVQLHGGITSSVFAHAVIPLLVHSGKRDKTAGTQEIALAGLVPLRRMGVAQAGGDQPMMMMMMMNSPAARCTIDPLCLVFSYLCVDEFLMAQRVCRSWRAARLHSQSWPHGGYPLVHAQMLVLADASFAVQLHALRSLQGEMRSKKQVLCEVEVSHVQKLLQLAQSPDIHMQMESIRVLVLISGILVDRLDGSWDHIGVISMLSTLSTLFRSSNSSTAIKSGVARILGNIATGKRIFDAVLHTDLLPSLFELCDEAIATGHVALLRDTSCLLSALCCGKPGLDASWIQAAFPVLVRLLLYETDEEVLTFACSALSGLAKDCAKYNPYIAAALTQSDARLPRRLLDLWQHTNEKVVLLSSRTVRHLIVNNHEQIMVECGLLLRLLDLLKHSNEQILRGACDILYEMNDGHEAPHESMFTPGVIQQLVRIMGTDDVMLINMSALRVISQISSCASEAQLQYLDQQGVISTLCDLLSSPNPIIAKYALQAINVQMGTSSENGSISIDQITAVCKSGAVSHIVKLLGHHRGDLQYMALTAIICISAGDHTHTRTIVDSGVLPHLRRYLLLCQEAEIRARACMALQNIAVDGEKHVEAIISADIIPSLITLILLDEEEQSDSQKKAAFAFCSTATSSNLTQISSLVQHGLVFCLSKILSFQDSEPLGVALSVCKHILFMGDTDKDSRDNNNKYAGMMTTEGLDRLIRALEQHELDDIRESAHHIVSTYFPAVVAVAPNIADEEIIPSSQ